MHIVALVSAILALLSLPLMAVMHGWWPMILAVALGVLAAVTGVLGRQRRRGKAGLALGLLALTGTLVYFFMFAAKLKTEAPAGNAAAPAVKIVVPEAIPAR